MHLEASRSPLSARHFPFQPLCIVLSNACLPVNASSADEKPLKTLPTHTSAGAAAAATLGTLSLKPVSKELRVCLPESSGSLQRDDSPHLERDSQKGPLTQQPLLCHGGEKAILPLTFVSGPAQMSDS